MKKTKQNYELYLNEIGTPEDDKKSNGVECQTMRITVYGYVKTTLLRLRLGIENGKENADINKTI